MTDDSMRTLSRREMLHRGASIAGGLVLPNHAAAAVGSADIEHGIQRAGSQASGVADPFASWRAGDLHTHTTYSHDVCSSPTPDGCDEPWTWGYPVEERIAHAERRGLDYLAITDHNTTAGQDDPAFSSDALTLLESYEHSLADGHAGFHGVSQTFDGPSETTGQLRRLLETVDQAGGMTVMNHPAYTPAPWGYGDPIPRFADAYEVWNIHWLYPDSNNPAALAHYDGLLSAGYKLPAVGGSDSHWRSTSSVQGAGQPTTWVETPSPSPNQEEILAAIGDGRTVVTWDWRGPKLRLDADFDRDGTYESGIGTERTASGSVPVHAIVENGAGERLRIVVDGDVVAETLIGGEPFVLETTVSVGGPASGPSWIRAEIVDGDPQVYRALTSPIYVT